MWISKQLQDLEQLEGQMLEDFINGILQNVDEMIETIELDSKNNSKDFNALSNNQILEIYNLYTELLSFFNKIEEYEVSAKINIVIKFFEKKINLN